MIFGGQSKPSAAAVQEVVDAAPCNYGASSQTGQRGCTPCCSALCFSGQHGHVNPAVEQLQFMVLRPVEWLWMLKSCQDLSMDPFVREISEGSGGQFLVGQLE